MKEPVKLLLIFVNESDRWNDTPLYQAIVDRLRHLHLAGATAEAGILGFADDRPITITVVDEETRIRAALPELRRMVHEGLILLLDAELVADVSRKA